MRPPTMSDPATPRSYPAVPAYGQLPPGSPPPRVPSDPGAPAQVPAGGRAAAAPRSGARLALGLSLVWNALTLLGVLAFGWPPGNVFLLFWAENAVLGLCTLVKVATARGAVPSHVHVSGIAASGNPVLLAVFFAFHYGLFCVVHLVFTIFVAVSVGVESSFLLLGFPVVLLAVRYTVETLTTWFGPEGQRRTTAPGMAMFAPYPRIIVLHLAVLVAFGLTIGHGAAASARGAWTERLAPLLATLPAGWRTPGVAVVLLLVLLKTVVDLITTRRAFRAR